MRSLLLGKRVQEYPLQVLIFSVSFFSYLYVKLSRFIAYLTGVVRQLYMCAYAGS